MRHKGCGVSKQSSRERQQQQQQQQQEFDWKVIDWSYRLVGESANSVDNRRVNCHVGAICNTTQDTRRSIVNLEFQFFNRVTDRAFFFFFLLLLFITTDHCVYCTMHNTIVAVVVYNNNNNSNAIPTIFQTDLNWNQLNVCTVCSHLPRFGRIITCRKGLINTLICYALVRTRKNKQKKNSAIYASPFRAPSIVPSSKQSKVLTVIN